MFDEEQRDEHDECRHEIDRLQTSEELAWVLIANAYGGNWNTASPEWKEAAEQWRHKYHDSLPDPVGPKMPEALAEHQPKYNEGAWRDYSLAELGQWVHLLVKRAAHRRSIPKRLKDLKDARNYWEMMEAWLDAADADVDAEIKS
ncbi:MAG: hypothetical protein ACYS7Y_11575 [Planctomycetota bacterium]|jgi:hypothetical protein